MHIVSFIEQVLRRSCGDPHIWAIATPPNYGVTEVVAHNVTAFGAHGYARIDVADTDPDRICAQVAMPFLGQRYVYILEGMYRADKRLQKRILHALCTSNIAHHVILFSDQDALLREYSRYARCTRVTSELKKSSFVRLYKAMFGQTFAQTYANDIFQIYPAISFERAYLVMWYYYLLGKNFGRWCTHWLSRVIAPDTSLFYVSHYFFQKNTTKLLLAWREMEAVYPPEFWVAFWAEQLWQAYMFITIAQEHTCTRARKSCSKLPFAFMDTYWRNTSRNELRCALTHIYTLDLRVKSGADTRMFELFFSYWLSRSFLHKSIWRNNAARNNDCHRFMSR